MSMYPRINLVTYQPENKTAKCIVCDEVADAKAFVEKSPYREDDDIVWTHVQHKSIETLRAWQPVRSGQPRNYPGKRV